MQAMANTTTSVAEVTPRDRKSTRLNQSRRDLVCRLLLEKKKMDHKLCEFVTKVTASLRLAGSETTELLQRVTKDLFPARFLYRPKDGFEMPLVEWFNRQLREH